MLRKVLRDSGLDQAALITVREVFHLHRQCPTLFMPALSLQLRLRWLAGGWRWSDRIAGRSSLVASIGSQSRNQSFA